MVEDSSELAFAVSEFPVHGSGSADILAFNLDGEIAIIECKLSSNPESRREVVGHVVHLMHTSLTACENLPSIATFL
ncbi:MAG: hypothetical protein NZ888_08215 [Candidatus Nitrosocaldus sp.]|nr:hypothetical protein [Candidatus Nitrosocaldus sp.]MDW8000980.1 hypothetical protein [Candidatus Nitrosocaldus sp.]